MKRSEQQVRILRKLQDMGYKGQMVYVPKHHMGDGVACSKQDGILEDRKKGLTVLEIARKYETSTNYVYYVQRRKNRQKQKKERGLKYEVWKEIVEAYPTYRKTGGYLYVPSEIKNKTLLIMQEFENGNFNVKQIAEKHDTTVKYVYMRRSEWLNSVNKGDR